MGDLFKAIAFAHRDLPLLPDLTAPKSAANLNKYENRIRSTAKLPGIRHAFFRGGNCLETSASLNGGIDHPTTRPRCRRIAFA
jgi:hypothetical protein